MLKNEEKNMQNFEMLKNKKNSKLKTPIKIKLKI